MQTTLKSNGIAYQTFEQFITMQDGINNTNQKQQMEIGVIENGNNNQVLKQPKIQ